MSTTIGVVDLPVTSTSSLAGASPEASAAQAGLARRRFAGSTLLQWVAQRMTEVQALDQTVVLLDSEHAELRQLTPPHIHIHVSDGADPLARLDDVCRAFDADAVVRVSVDCPFFDPVLVDNLVCEASESPCDYATYCAGDGTSSIQSRLGLVAEWIGAEALHRADRQADGEDRQRPSECIWTHPESYKLRFIKLPKPLDQRGLQLVIDSEEDWDHAHQIYEALGPDGIDWRRIAVLLQLHDESRQTEGSAANAVNEEAG